MSKTPMNQKVTDAADKALDAATSAVDAAKEAGRTVRDEVTSHATEALETARDIATDRAEDVREAVASTGKRLAHSLQDQADQAAATQARVLGSIANGVTQAADALRSNSVGDIVASATAYARRHPGAVAVGAAVAGFALARMMRSSGTASAAAARAVDETSRIYHEAARHSIDKLGRIAGKGKRP